MRQDTRPITVLMVGRRGITIGVLFLLACAVGFGIGTDGPTGVGVFVFFGLCAAFLVAAYARVRVRLDGTVLTRRGVFSTSSVDLARVDAVALKPNNTGMAMLDVRGGGRSLQVAVLAKTVYVDRALPVDQLLLLAAALGDRPEVAGVVLLLRQQAAHLQGGGGHETSPLAGLLRDWTRTAGAAGAAGAAGGIADL